MSGQLAMIFDYNFAYLERAKEKTSHSLELDPDSACTRARLPCRLLQTYPRAFRLPLLLLVSDCLDSDQCAAYGPRLLRYRVRKGFDPFHSQNKTPLSAGFYS
jgi:hypothetical protein